MENNLFDFLLGTGKKSCIKKIDFLLVRSK